jgi:adenylate kinase family enzyme
MTLQVSKGRRVRQSELTRSDVRETVFQSEKTYPFHAWEAKGRIVEPAGSAVRPSWSPQAPYDSNPDLCRLMKRIVILGRGGAGKSTFARKLGETTGLPVVELDRHFWQPGLVPTPHARWTEIQRRLADQERWIMDGDLGKYDELSVRLLAADTVLILDFGIFVCLIRAIRRSKERMDFWWWLLTWRWIERPKIKKAIAEYASHADVRIFSRPAELERLLLNS